MCRKTSRAGALVLGLGLGLLGALLFGGWFLQVLTGVGLIVVGLLLLGC